MTHTNRNLILVLIAWVTLMGACNSPAPTSTDQNPSATTTTGPPADPTFEFDPMWPKPLPNNWTLGNVVGVAVDARDHVWIVHRPGSLTPQERGAAATPPLAECCFPAPPVIEFNQDGDVVQAWGGPGEGYEWPEAEHGIFIDHLDNVWLGGSGGTDSQILKFTRSGDFLLQIGAQGLGQGSNDIANFGMPIHRLTKSLLRTDMEIGGSPFLMLKPVNTSDTGEPTATCPPTRPTPTTRMLSHQHSSADRYTAPHCPMTD